MFTSVGSYSLINTGSKSGQISISSFSQMSKTSETQDESINQDGSTLTISTLSTQLAISARLIDEMVATLSPDELAKKAKAISNQISRGSDDSNKTKHDSELPQTDDPELLARAKQATAYVNDASKGGHSVKNPFSGLSREQLSSIVYNDSGTFTVNERQAAWRESYNQEEAWGEKVAAQAVAEYKNSGKMTHFFTSVLEHFNQLPAIEQAQYPKDYATDLQSKIALDFNYRTNQAGDDEKTQQSFLDMIFDSLIKKITNQQQVKNRLGNNSQIKN